MALPKYKFKCWCEKAVSGILFPPDQKTVYQELMDHMEDRYDELREQGVEDEIAQQQVVESMGDPWPIAKDLAQIHRPFWGYFLRITRVILIIVLIISLLPIGAYLWNRPYSLPYGSFDEVSISADVGTARRILYTEPNKTLSAEGYRITMSRAVWHYIDYTDETSQDLDRLRIRLRVFHPLPWASVPEFLNYFWAEDSLGNRYDAMMEESARPDAPRIIVDYDKTTPLTYIVDLWPTNFCSQEADWIALHYTRDGRDLTFYLDLTGGDPS